MARSIRAKGIERIARAYLAADVGGRTTLLIVAAILNAVEAQESPAVLASGVTVPGVAARDLHQPVEGVVVTSELDVSLLDATEFSNVELGVAVHAVRMSIVDKKTGAKRQEVVAELLRCRAALASNLAALIDRAAA